MNQEIAVLIGIAFVVSLAISVMLLIIFKRQVRSWRVRSIVFVICFGTMIKFVLDVRKEVKSETPSQVVLGALRYKDEYLIVYEELMKNEAIKSALQAVDSKERARFLEDKFTAGLKRLPSEDLFAWYRLHKKMAEDKAMCAALWKESIPTWKMGEALWKFSLEERSEWNRLFVKAATFEFEKVAFELPSTEARTMVFLTTQQIMISPSDRERFRQATLLRRTSQDADACWALEQLFVLIDMSAESQREDMLKLYVAGEWLPN